MSKCGRCADNVHLGECLEVDLVKAERDLLRDVLRAVSLCQPEGLCEGCKRMIAEVLK